MERLAIDLDKTLCELKRPDQTYLDVLPLEGAVNTMQFLKSEGYYLIIYTARGMATYNGNMGLININRLPDIITWLKKWGIPYDEIVLGKVHYDYIICDKAIEFTTWEKIKNKFTKQYTI